MKKILIRLTGLKLLGSLVGLVYSVLQIRYFGASGKVDAFFVAMTALNMITSLIQAGQLSEVFLPEYLKQKNDFGYVAAQKLLSAVLNRMIVVVGLILLILYFVAPLVISSLGPGLAPKYKDLSVNLFVLTLFLILFTLVSAFVSTTLNAEQIYGRVEVTGIINGVVSIILLVLFYKKLDVYILVWSLLAGKIVEFLISLYFLKQIGFKYHLNWNVDDYKLSNFFKVMFATSGFVGATQLNIAIMTAMSSFLPTGSLSIFNYVQQLSTKANAIIMGPVSTVFFSQFSNAVALGKQNLVAQMKKPLSGVFILTYLIFCLILLTGRDLLHFLWSKKSLSPQEFSVAYWMLWLNFFGSIFSSTGTIYRKAAISLGKAKAIYQSSIFVQLFLGLYSFVSIYYFGIIGLGTIIVLHKVLMTLAAYIISEKSGVETKGMIYELLTSRKSVLFFGISLLSTFILLFGIDHLALSSLINIIAKSIFFTMILFFLIMNLYRIELNDLVLSFRKK